MKKLIRKIVKKYGTRNPFELAEAMGAITITAPLPAGTRGYYTYYKRNGIICVDENLGEEMARMVCAHELGHFILHRTENAVLLKSTTFLNTNKYEIEANTFAAELLIPDESLEDYQDQSFNIRQLASALGVSEYLLTLKLR